MTSRFSTELLVSLDDSQAFARLSGDYNPLHVNPVAARRTRFGSTVTHGIHLFLRALDELAARNLFGRGVPAALSATFGNAVLTGSSLCLQACADGNKVRFSAETGGLAAFTGTVEFQPSDASILTSEDAEFATDGPDEADFPPAVTEGSVPLRLNRRLVVRLFPSLAKLTDTSWIADLLATTQIVGMRCPGMHSIYSGFRLRGVPRQQECHTMRYCVNSMEHRFQLLRLEVTGSRLTGTVEAFFRARPVAQRSIKDIAAVVPPRAFADHRVLIVGGSRGLGELTAKIVAAGSAEVAITYALGREDAERVCTELRAFGRACNAHHLDLSNVGSKSSIDWLRASKFSHVYFFASPRIASNFGQWNDALFHRFTDIYVTAFQTVIECALEARGDENRPVHFLYPSSIFVTQPEVGFLEYAVAKAAGEALCDQLQGNRGALFARPRLPRMRTDQTNAIADTGAADPLPILLEIVRHLHS